MTATEKILDQIRRIRNLADNAGTEGEAAAAAAMMQRLLAKYNLDLSEIPTDEPDEDRDEAVSQEIVQTQTKQNDYKWREELLSAIASSNFCRILHTKQWPDGLQGKSRAAMIIIGQPHNREVVKFLYEILTEAIERLGKPYSLRSTGEGESLGYGRKSYTFSPRRAFYYGAVEVLEDRLIAEHRSFLTKTVVEHRLDGTIVEREVNNEKALALVRESTAAVDTFVKKQYPKLGVHLTNEAAGAHPTNSPSAYQAGRAAGSSIPLQRGLGSGSSRSTGTKALGSGR